MYLDLPSIRKHLHAHPEVSGKEEQTAIFLKNQVSKFNPDQIIDDLGHYSFAAVFNEAGTKTILFRADMDALPIQEMNQFDHRSKIEGVSHKCGHDGHSTILLGLAEQISKNELSIRVVLLFQSAEETGEGARTIIESRKLEDLKIDSAYSLHNIPGVAQGSILCKPSVFCPASTGIKIQLMGKESHASEPQNGISPVWGVQRLISEIKNLNTKDTFATITHINMGEKAFGISPAKADFWCTLRSFSENGIENYLRQLESSLNELHDLNLSSSLTLMETFEASVNNTRSFELINAAAKSLGLEFTKMEKPNPWSEDFSLFTKQYSGAMLGIGSGEECQPLHDPSYDFPDEIIPTAIAMFKKIIELESA